MKNPQVINLLEDSVLVFDGDNVIDNTDQQTIGRDKVLSEIIVDITFYDLIAGEIKTTIENVTMTYESLIDFWTIDVADVSSTLEDRHKYVALINEHSGGTVNMREFKIKEFAVDNDSFEDTWMRLPYQIELSPTPKIIWYDTIDPLGTPKFEALAYQGGEGTTPATSASTITHRGPIVPVVV
jgi:hypothetical protein